MTFGHAFGVNCILGRTRDVWREVESDAHARCGALNFNGDVQSYDARSSKHFDKIKVNLMENA